MNLLKKTLFYHWITFLFIKRDYKRLGYGRQLTEFLEIEAWNFSSRPIRIESANKAVEFFVKCGYSQIGEPKESICGSSLFRFLYLLEKVCKWHHVENWDEEG